MRILKASLVLVALVLSVGVPLALTATSRADVATPTWEPGSAGAAVSVTGAPIAATVASPAPVTTTIDLAEARERELSPQYKHLRDFVLDVMRSWPKGSKELPTADLFDVASDITAAVLIEPTTVEVSTGKDCTPIRAGSDRCYWGGVWNTDGAKAIMLASLAYWEGSRFAAYADESLCTDKAWRKSPTGKHFMHLGGDCDGGRAFTLWQIHPFDLLKGQTGQAICDRENVAPGMFDGAYGLNRFGAARCALELARGSMVQRDNLSRYTGEIGYVHPKADERLEFARKAIAKHPFKDL